MAYDYSIRIRNAKGIKLIPAALAPWLDDGNPVAFITGTRGAPALRIADEQGVQGLWDGLWEGKEE